MQRHSGRQRCRLLMAAAVALVSACSGESWVSGSGSDNSAAQRLHDACVVAMLQSTCRVANDRSSTSAVPLAETVFVAGVGPVDVQAYRAIRASGDAMCETVRQSCLADWEGAQCLTARSLWPSSSVPTTAAPR